MSQFEHFRPRPAFFVFSGMIGNVAIWARSIIFFDFLVKYEKYCAQMVICDKAFHSVHVVSWLCMLCLGCVCLSSFCQVVFSCSELRCHAWIHAVCRCASLVSGRWQHWLVRCYREKCLLTCHVSSFLSGDVVLGVDKGQTSTTNPSKMDNLFKG